MSCSLADRHVTGNPGHEGRERLDPKPSSLRLLNLRQHFGHIAVAEIDSLFLDD